MGRVIGELSPIIERVPLGRKNHRMLLLQGHGMKISDIKAVYPKYTRVVPSWRTHFWQIVVRVETNAGVSGLASGGGGVAGVEIVNRHFRELLLGRDVSSMQDIAAIWDDLYAASLPYGRKGLAIM